MWKWTDDEYVQLREALGRMGTPEERRASIEAIASRAVELAAARGGTMADEVDAHLQAIYAGEDAPVGRMGEIIAAFAALGARNATLEAEVTTLSERLVQANQRAQENWDKQEAERERLQGERDAVLRRAEHAEERIRQLAIAGQELSAAVDKHVGAPSDVAPGSTFTEKSARRYPCSPTCTHDDAATPGHSERVKVRSEAFKADPSLSVTEAATYEQGAEAMRAQIRADVAAECDRHGLAWTPAFKAIIAAIMGAKP